MNPKYPDVEVVLVGTDGNAFAIIGKVMRALKSAGVSQDKILEFRVEAMDGDYDNVLQTAMKWVEVF